MVVVIAATIRAAVIIIQMLIPVNHQIHNPRL
jgi:hypothetical protein